MFRFFLDSFSFARPRCIAVLAAAVVAAPALAQTQQALDADTCAALAADAGRLGSKYLLGQRACAGPVANALPPRNVAPARAQQSQQLYLYESPLEAPPLTPLSRVRPAAVPSLPRVPSAGSSPLAPLSPVVRKTPSRTISSNAAGARALQLAPAIDAAARAHDIDPLLMHAIARVESRHDAAAVSPAGARGVMQVMPATARRFGVGDARALHHAQTNLGVGAAYLKTLQRRFGNELVLVLAAYNAGEGAVERHGRRVPPYAETERYVRDVGAEYERLRAAAARAPGAGTAVASALPGPW